MDRTFDVNQVFLTLLFCYVLTHTLVYSYLIDLREFVIILNILFFKALYKVELF